MRFFNFKVTTLLVSVALVACSETPEPAVTEEGAGVDWILTNGQILTVDQDFSVVRAMAITDGRIVATGSDEDISALAGAETQQTDLAGQTVVPGLIDNHLHYVRAARQWYREVRWDGVTSREQALEMFAERARELPEDEWVLVLGGWIFSQFQDNSELFTLAELDAVVPDKPVFVQEGYRRAFVNTAALVAAGITSETQVSGRGRVVLDDAGNVTGELVGGAFALASAAFPEISAETWNESLQAANQDMHRMGLTTVYDVGGNSVTGANYDAVEQLLDANNLSMRVFYTLNERNSNAGSAEEIIAEMQSHTPDNDGLSFAQFGYGETVYRPMRANPWDVSQETLDSFQSVAISAVEHGWQLHEHSTRDVKIQAMLSVFEKVNETHPIGDLRWTIAHTNGISAESVVRARDLGVVFAVHSSRRNVTPQAIENAGEAGLHQPPAKTIHELNGIWGLGSDATFVASPNPFHTLGWVVSGRSASGDVTLVETVSREAALTAHTRSNGYILFREDDLGSLEPGKLADFAVLDRDYMAVPEEEIENLYSVMTVVEGEIVYSEN